MTGREIPIRDAKKKAGDSATMWFAVLEGALRKGDNSLANEAKSELQRLGVSVTFDDTPRLGAQS